MNLRVRLEELLDLPGLVGGEIVGDDVDFFAARLVHDDIGKEGDEFSRGVPRRGLAQYLSVLGIEGRVERVERERSMPVVLKAMPLGSSRRQRQHRIKPIEGLNGGLFVKVRIVRSHVPIEPMGLEAVNRPGNPGDSVV